MYASRFIIIIGLIFGAAAGIAGQSVPVWGRPLAKCWTLKDPSVSAASLASDNANRLFYTKTSSSITGLNVLTGNLLWTVDIGGTSLGGPVATLSNVVSYALTEDAEHGRELKVFSIESESGISKLIQRIALPSRALVGEGDGVAIIADAKGRLTFVEGKSVTNSTDSGLQEPTGISAKSSSLLVWDREMNSRLIDISTGSLIAAFQLRSRPSGSFALDLERIYVGSGDGSLTAVSRNHGVKLWSTRMGGAVEGIVSIGKVLMVSSRDNFVYLLSAENGNRKWKRKLPGRIIGRAVLDAEHAAFLTLGSNEVFVLRLTDGRLVNSFPVEEAEYFVSGPVFAAGRLIVPHNAGITSFGPESLCKQEKGS